MKTKEQILTETVTFYHNNPDKRAYDEAATTCMYKTADGHKCAVGRYLTDEGYTLIVDNGYDMNSVNDLIDVFEEVDPLLQPEVRGHEPEFWSRLQTLHDSIEHWSSEGITGKGLDYVAYYIILHFGLNPQEVKLPTHGVLLSINQLKESPL
jgi:hypothetical protein